MQNRNKFAGLSHATALPGESEFSIDIDMKDSHSLTLDIPVSEVGSIIAYLATTAGELNSGNPQENFDPIPVDAIGFAESPTPHETILILRSGNYHLSFSLANANLAEFGDDISRIARLISAPQRPAH